jgi:cytochrome c553
MKRENKLELMHLQANGYSDEQIRLIDDYFNNLSAKIGGE